MYRHLALWLLIDLRVQQDQFWLHSCNSLFHQSSSQLLACCGTFGPPAGLLTIMLSTESTDTAASVASRIAHDLAARESTIPASFALSVPSFSSCITVPCSLGVCDLLEKQHQKSYLHVDSPYISSFLFMLRPQSTYDLVPLRATQRVLRQRSRHDFQRTRKPFYSML